MPECFYHAAEGAKAQCLGCKQPICGACRDGGLNGFCASCFKKVASLGAQVTDVKKTGMVSGTRMKATIVKMAGAPEAPDLAMCFQHFDARATGTCPTCDRAYCSDCLDPTTDLCRFCLAQEAAEELSPAPEPEPVPVARPKPPVRPAPVARPAPAPARRPAATAAAPSKPAGDRKLLMAGAVMLGLIVLLVIGGLLRRPAAHPAAAPTLEERALPPGANPGARQNVLGHDAGRTDTSAH